MRNKQLTCILLAITILESLMSLSPVYPQTACHFASFRPFYPESTPAGQNFEVSTTVTVVCSGAADPTNEVRVDLADGHNPQNILSKSAYTYPTQPSITTTLVNDVTAPLDTGPWVLQVNAYVIGRPSGAALASNQQLFNVLVVPYTPTTTISKTTIIPTVTPKPFTSTASQQVLPTQTSTTIITSSEVRKQDNSTYYAIAAVIVLIAIAIGIIAMMRRKKRKVEDKTRVY